eukprot:Hpha_TRINITY_DN15451_c1_g1::TRINITY_DN15451_c1_g1_i1::g.174810::m.174810
MAAESAERLCELSGLREEGLLTEEEFYDAVQMMSGDLLAPLDEMKGGGKNSSGGLQLFVMPTNDIGTSFPIELDPEATVASLKEDIAAQTGIKMEKQQLTFAGERLTPEMDCLMLADVGVCPQCTLDLAYNHPITWDVDHVPGELEVTPFEVQSSVQSAGTREDMKYATSQQILDGHLCWEMSVSGCPRTADKTGRLRRGGGGGGATSNAADAPASLYIGIANSEIDPGSPRKHLKGSVTWGNNGEVKMDFQNYQSTQTDTVKSTRLQYGSGSMVGFSFDKDKKSLSLWKNGERVHFIGPTGLFLDSYRAICSPGEGAGIQCNRDATFA